MRLFAVLGTAILFGAGLTAAAPAEALPATPATVGDTVQIEDILEDPSFEIVDQAQAEDALQAAGFDVDAIEETGTEVSMAVNSDLGDGTEVTTEVAIDVAEQAAVATLSADGGELSDTNLEVVIHEMTDDEIDITVTDAATGESQRFSTASGEGAAVPLIIGIPLILAVLEAFLKAATVMVVAGLTYVVISEAISAINRGGSKYVHFMAMRVSGKPLMIGNGLTFSSAVTRVKTKLDVWSLSQTGAMTVCKSASGGKVPIGPERDVSGSFKVRHYHTSPRNGSHCFFGTY